MRLLYSAGSPFARLVWIALLETGPDTSVTKHEVTRTRLYSPESDVLCSENIALGNEKREVQCSCSRDALRPHSPMRNRKFADSSLEESGFEISVPRQIAAVSGFGPVEAD